MLRSTVFTLILAIVFFIAERYGSVSWLHPAWKAMLVFFLSVSFLIHRLMEVGFQNNREKFVPFYMATLIARMILCLVFVGFFLYQGVGQRKVFIVNFLILYISYMGFEIYGLNRNLRRDL